jgi:phosphoglycerate dehydrogenase-like enzyme
MTPASPAPRPIRVLFTGSRANPSWEPWGRDMLRAVSRSHDVSLVDPGRPLADQVADPAIEAVLDAYSLVTPEVAAAAAGHVRLWQLGSVGYDHVDVAALARHGVPTANCPGFTSSRSLAEEALMLASMLMRSYNGLLATVEAGGLGVPTGRQLAGLTLAIIGFGASGRELARRAAAFGMRTIAIGHASADPELEQRYGLSWMGGLDRLDGALAEADVVSLHVPLTAETRNILDARRLGLMKAGAVVVNVSRGGLIDEAALADEVRSGHLFGAGLDVVAGEPSAPDHPLRGIPQVIILPHVAGATDATSRRRARFAALNISRLRYGLEPLCRVDGLPPQG